MTISSDSETAQAVSLTAAQSPDAAPRPELNGDAVMDAICAPLGYFGLPIAHQRGLFRLLEGRQLTAAEIGAALELKPRPTNALLAGVTALGLLQRSNGRYALTALARNYLLESSPTYMGFLVDMAVAGEVSLSGIDEAVASDSIQRPDMDFATFEQQAEQARVFTRAMHSLSVEPSLAWPQLVDLAGDRVFLDVGAVRARTRSAPAFAGRTCRRSCSTCPRCARSPKSSSPATASRAAPAHNTRTCGTTPSRPPTPTSSRTSSTTGRPRKAGSSSRRPSRPSGRAAASSSTRRSSTTTRPAP
jgi:hypothetical protein